MNCPNCNAKLSCGCQRRTASDGKAVCSACLVAYENKIKPHKQPQRFVPPKQEFTLDPTAPTDIRVTYKPPVKS